MCSSIVLANGRRHNQVLRKVCEAVKAVVSKANLRAIANHRKIYFLCEGFPHLCKKRCQTPSRDILAEVNDWTVAPDIEEMIESGKRPDMVLVSPSTDDIIMVELTVPWEDRLEHVSRRKSMQICRWTWKRKTTEQTSSPSRLAQGA